MEASEALWALCCELCDGVSVLCPRGWTKVRLPLERGARGLRITQIQAELPDSPAPKPELGLDEQARLGGMNAAVEDIAQLLASARIAWDGAAITLARPKEGALFATFLAQDGRPAHGVSVPAELLGGLFITEPLFELALASAAALEQSQGRWDAALTGCQTWGFDQRTQQVSFQVPGRGGLTAPAQLIGTWSQEDDSWLWSWANTSVDPKCFAEIEKATSPDARAPGLGALWRERFGCEEGFAQALARIAAHRAGARAVHRGRSGTTTAFLALMAEPP